MLIKSAEQAWHDAYADSFVHTSKLEPRIQGTARKDTLETYLGELAKIKKCIEHLPKDQYAIGMYAFAPLYAINLKIKKNVEQVAWNIYKAEHDITQHSAADLEIAILLCRYATLEAREQLMQRPRKYSQRELAKLLEVPLTTYQRSWHKSFLRTQQQLVDVGTSSLIKVGSTLR